MAYYKRYSNDPKWITAKFNSKCNCGNEIKNGDRIFYYPLTKTALCTGCSDTASRQFESECFDEFVYNN